jgi:predicted nucleotide-binding protein (sugar kinase/HSP70/actin superfamily)
MEPKTQTKAEDKIKELKKENRRLVRELLEAKEALDKYKQDVNILTRHVVMLENIVLDLINTHYGEKVRADFTKFELCIDQRCVRFGEYEELLVALRILPLLAQ